MTRYTVGTLSELQDALAQARGGDEILLAPGAYGDLKLINTSFASTVTLKAADPDDPPVFDSIGLWKVDHLTFDGITLDFKPDAETVEWDAGFRADFSSEIAVMNSVVTGGDAVGGISADAPAGSQGNNGINGYPIGEGLKFLNTTGITLENNTVSGFRSGMSFNNVDDLAIVDNEIKDVRTVPVAGGNVNNVLMEGNYIHDINPWKFSAAGDHGDFVHFWTTPAQTEPSQNLVFKDNYFAQGDGYSVLGIYIDDDWNDMGFQNVVVENNVLHNGQQFGLLMEDVDGLTVRNNTFVQSEGSSQDAPNIHLADGTKNVVIEGNIVPDVTGPALQNASGNNIVIGDNTFIQNVDPNGANYVGDLLVNGLAAAPELSDFRVVPGGAADGYGSTLPGQGSVAAAQNGFITDTAGEGFDMASYVFSINDITQPATADTYKDARITWDFGDGTTGTGQNPDHHYEAAGTYVVQAKVEHPDGETFVISKTVEVATPSAIHTDFAAGLSDSSDDPHTTKVMGDVRLVESEKGQSVRMGQEGSALLFKPSQDILNNAAFSISIAFKKDAGFETEWGGLVHFAGTASINVTNNGITLRGSTSDNESININTGNIGLDDTEWHLVTYTFSQDDGAAILYVDGAEVARVDGLTGSQYTTPSHGLYLGSPWGPKLDGLLDNVSFLRGALTSEDVAASYDSFLANEEFVLPGAPDETPQKEHQQGTSSIYKEAEVEEATASAAPEAPADEAAKAPPVDMHAHEGTAFDMARLDAQTSGLLHDVMGKQDSFQFGGADGYVKLGRDPGLEQSDRLAMSIEFTNDDLEGGYSRLVWNHTRFELALHKDGLILGLATADGQIKHFTVKDLGLSDGESHQLSVFLDDAEDRVQVVVDNALVLDKTGTDFDNDGRFDFQWGWSIGTPWDNSFEGEVTDFRLGDQFDFIDVPEPMPEII